ncbi:MAG: GNAT family N-acetyltransferase [Filifactoraceae bacterium]
MAIKKSYKIRNREIEDALEFHSFLNKLDSEAKYLMYDVGERDVTVEEIGEMIAITEEDGIFSNIVLDGNRIVAYIVALPEMLNRNKHCASVVIGILEKFQRQGLGNKLLKAAELWARENGIKRLEATIVEDNKAAINLFEKRNYSVEGKKISSILIGENYFNEMIFGKILE